MNSMINKLMRKYSDWRNKKFDLSRIYFWDELNTIDEVYFRLKSDKFVISVGNLTFGGTGKTPFLETLIKNILTINSSICIVERGYNRIIKSDLIITPENITNFSIDMVGDEPLMIFEKTNMPVSISENKFKAFYNAIKQINPDFILIDDGFQHRWIERDIDILILDKSTITNPNFPPKGRLREPLSSIKRADVVLVPEEFADFEFENTTYKQLILNFSFVEGEIRNVFDTNSVSSLQKIDVITGIANPERFINSIIKKGLKPITKNLFPDHHQYKKSDIEKVIHKSKLSGNSLITTDKDLVKLRVFKELFQENKVNLYVLPIEFRINDSENKLFNLIYRKFKEKNGE